MYTTDHILHLFNKPMESFLWNANSLSKQGEWRNYEDLNHSKYL